MPTYWQGLRTKTWFEYGVVVHIYQIGLTAWPMRWVLWSGRISVSHCFSLPWCLLILNQIEFSDALSSIDPAFLANVKAEAEHQVRLANSHPSLAVCASKNGIELGFELIARAVLPAAFGAVKTRYEKLFLDTLLHAVFDNTRSISYSPSSITNGYLSFNYSLPTPIIERCDNATAGTIFGNTDYYNYNVTKAINDSGYPIRRFAT